MSNEHNNMDIHPHQDPDQHISMSTALDDEQRIKVMSPGMLVVKRFFRNKLAIMGLIIITFMFLFSFLGAAVSPYGETERFRGYEMVSKEYAAITINNELRYTTIDGTVFPDALKAKVVLATTKGESTFVNGADTYQVIVEDTDFLRISRMMPVATGSELRGEYNLIGEDGFTVSQELADAFSKAVAAGQTSFTLADGTFYSFVYERRLYTLMASQEFAIASKMVYDTTSSEHTLSYGFKNAAETAIRSGTATEFTADGKTYQLVRDSDNTEIYDGVVLVSIVSPYAIKETENGTVLSLEFKAAAQEALVEGHTEFQLANALGEMEDYRVVRKENQYTIMKDTETYLIRTYEAPSGEHWLGTDANGMDILTRLMYGGRVSLIIGFVVVLIELSIGVILGGVAGYFGKWIDNVIMRIVDIFYCIPNMPLYIIIGAVMDSLKMDPRIRIYVLMLLLGLVGWPSIARMVRGQILSLREQEFMTATEATGLSVSRRIFRHLVPNVVPQLIVISTMTLGSIILTEATLSFLGLGVKFPYASWGNIITAVSNSYVLTNYWFVWIPAGCCILLTVLGFNFIGDGLRDAFDPKMKR